MIQERREHFRYPTWLPATVSGGPTEPPTNVRVVDWSMGGASIDGARFGSPAARLTLRVDWSGLDLTVATTIVATEPDSDFPVTHVRFDHLTPAQELEIAALVGAKAAAFREGQRGLLQYLASTDS